MNSFVNVEFFAEFANKTMLISSKKAESENYKTDNKLLFSIRDELKPVTSNFDFFVVTDKNKINISKKTVSSNINWDSCFKFYNHQYVIYKNILKNEIRDVINSVQGFDSNTGAFKIYKEDILIKTDKTDEYKPFDIAVVSSNSKSTKNIIWLRNCNIRVKKVKGHVQTKFTEFTFDENEFVDFNELEDINYFNIVSSISYKLKDKSSYYDNFLMGSDKFIENMVNKNISDSVCQQHINEIKNYKHKYFINNFLRKQIPCLNKLLETETPKRTNKKDRQDSSSDDSDYDDSYKSHVVKKQVPNTKFSKGKTSSASKKRKDSSDDESSEEVVTKVINSKKLSTKSYDDSDSESSEKEVYVNKEVIMLKNKIKELEQKYEAMNKAYEEKYEALNKSYNTLKLENKKLKSDNMLLKANIKKDSNSK